MKFICITQTQHLTSFKSSKGTDYISLKGHPFEVNDPDDQNYFLKFPQRFKKVGFLDSTPPPESVMDNDEELEYELSELKGVSVRTAKKVAGTYMDRPHLEDAILTGDKLTGIPKKQAEIIINWIMEDK